MEILGLIIIVLIWVFKAAAANEDKKVNDRETGSVSASPDELIKKAKRTVEDLDALRGQTEKSARARRRSKRSTSSTAPTSGRETSSATPMSAHTAKSAGRSRAGSRPTAARCILSTWTAARTGLRV